MGSPEVEKYKRSQKQLPLRTAALPQSAMPFRRICSDTGNGTSAWRPPETNAIRECIIPCHTMKPMERHETQRKPRPPKRTSSRIVRNTALWTAGHPPWSTRAAAQHVTETSRSKLSSAGRTQHPQPISRWGGGETRQATMLPVGRRGEEYTPAAAICCMHLVRVASCAIRFPWCARGVQDL